MDYQDPNIKISSVYLDPAESPIEAHATVLNIWNELRGDRFAPAWGDFQLTDFPLDLISSMSVSDITSPPLKSIYRFWGTKLTEVYGADFTGRSPNEVPPSRQGMDNQMGCAVILRERKPHLNVREYENIRGFTGRVFILRMPLSDDGEAVSQSFAVSHFETGFSDSPHKAFFEKIFSQLS